MAISKEDSWRLKGIALIMMVSMHVMRQDWMNDPDMLWDIKINGRNLSYIITVSIHASSAIFAFITGYAWGYKTSGKIKKIISIYISYWIVLLMVNCPVIWIEGAEGAEDLKDFVLCMMALSSKLSAYCWYVSFFAFAVMTFPVVRRVFDRLKCNAYMKILITLFFFYGMRVIVKILGRLGFGSYIIVRFLSMYGTTMPVLVTGYLVHFYDLLTVIDMKTKRAGKVNSVLLAILFLGVLSIIKGYLFCFLGFQSSLEAIWIIYEMYCVIILVQCACQIKCVDKMLTWLGRQSLYIWLIHSVFMIAEIQKFTFMLHIPVLVIIMVMVISALISIPVGYVDRKVQRMLRIKC